MTLFKRVLRTAIDYNVIYLLSALFVLLGCLQLMNGPSMATGSVLGKTVMLLAVLQAYELVLLLVGYSVYKRQGNDHDGLMLAVIMLLLLFDPTFFNNRLYTCADSVVGGLLANLVVLGLAAFKLHVIVRHTCIPFTERFAATLLGAAGFVFLSPALFHAAPAEQRPFLLFLLCAVVPLVPLCLTRPRGEDEGTCPDRPWSSLHHRFEKYAFFIPSLLIPLHLYELGQIYDQPFLPAVLPWALLALGAGLMKLGGEFGQASWVHVVLVTAAVATAGLTSAPCAPAGFLADAMTPLRCMLLAGGLYLVLAWAVSDDEDCLWYASAFSVLMTAGGTPSTIWTNLTDLHAGWIFILLLNLLARSVLRGTFGDHLATGMTGALFVCRVVPMTPVMSLHAFVQLAGLSLLLASHLLQNDDLSYGLGLTVSLTMVGMSAVYALDGLGYGPLVAVVLHGQIVTALYLWRRHRAAWAAPAGVLGCLRFHLYPTVAGQGGAVSSTLWAWSGHLSLVAAFGFLLLGYYVSINKERLLADLDTVEE